jgi:hypothetical protein
MARVLSTRAIQEAQALESGDVWLILLTLNHAGLTAPVRVVNNNEEIISNGEKYLAYPFDITLATDDGEHLPQIQLTIDNVERTLVESIRSIAEPPEIDLVLVLASSPDNEEIKISGLTLREVSYDAFTISGTLMAEDILNQKYPADVVSLAAGYIGLFN